MLNGISDQMGAQFDRLRCEVCQNLILSSINTGLLRHAVATVLTVYGIETDRSEQHFVYYNLLQQCLPFTVLKHNIAAEYGNNHGNVATVLTVYGIETKRKL